MIRKAIRIILPVALRRPLADWVYGLIGRIPSAHPVSLAKHIAQEFFWYWWRRLAAFRHLLSREPDDLPISDCFRRKVLEISVSLPDRWYRIKFENLSLMVQALRPPKVAESRDEVLVVIGTLGAGGAERQATLTASGLVERGYTKLRVVSTRLQPNSTRFFLSYLEQQGVPVSELNSIRRQDSPELAHVLAEIGRLMPSSMTQVSAYVREFSIHQPSIVHLWLDEVNIKAGFAAVILGIPTIILGLRSLPPCNFIFHQPYMREAYRWLVKQPGVKLVNNSHAGARAYEHWLGIPDSTIQVIYNGFDFNIGYLEKCRVLANKYREVHGLSTSKPVIGTVIRFTEEKRPFLWLEIAAQVRRRCTVAQFLMVGDGPLRSVLESRAQQDDLRGAVTFVGNVKNPLQAMAAMDIFLLTSRVEGLPNVLVEAQAVGVPVVTTNVGGASETMLDRVTGWVLESDKSNDAAHLIERLISDEKWCDRARLAMPAFVSETFGLERMLNETMAIYGKQ
jgi:glycosyltransferase involved in cell wall biosynthesis